jgi:RND family efflux transporter MFP subunit
MKKNFLGIGILAIIIIGFVVGEYVWKDVSTRPQFSSYKAGRGSIAEILDVSGKVQSKNNSDIGFEINGTIADLAHKSGDRVKAGEVLATVKSADLEAQYDQAVSLEKSAQAVLAQDRKIKDEFKHKLTSLEKSDAGSADKEAQRSLIDSQQSAIDAQVAQVAAAEANVESKKAQLEKAVLRAPFDGVISRQDAEIGEIVSAQKSIITVMNDKAYEIDINVAQVDVDSIHLGDTAEVSLVPAAGTKYGAKIVEIDPAQINASGISTYKVVLEFSDNVPAISAGMDAEVLLATGQKNNALVIPQKAVYQENGQSFVYEMKGGLRQKKTVSTGIKGKDGMVEITSGLGDGEEILVLN